MREMGAKKALEWFRELDMDYRSLKTGGQCEAIMNLAPRLLQWSLEGPVDQAAADHLGLDPGQEQASANAIFSRLADSFKTGSNVVRLCIVKVLVHVYRGHRKAGTSCRSLLSRERISGHADVLKKVQSVATSTDLTARCLGLRALGCLAELDSDASDLHRLVLLSIDSMHEQEVDAAFFAAGCFSENSASFAAVCWRKIKNVLETSTALNFAAIRLLSKLWVSSSVAADIHKFGREIIQRHPSRELVTAMLTALSNLVKKAKLLLPSHVPLLLECANSTHDASVQMLSLVFLAKFLPQAVYYLESAEQELSPLVAVIKDISRPPAIRTQALRVLCKVVSAYPAPCCSRDLISTAEASSREGDASLRFQAMYLLVEVTCKLERSNAADNESAARLQMISSLLCDLITSSKAAAAFDYCCLTRKLVADSSKACGILMESLLERIRQLVSREEQNDVSGDTIMRDAADDQSDRVRRLCRCLVVCCNHFDLSCSKVTAICQRIAQVSDLLSSSDAYHTDMLPATLKATSVEDVATPGYVRELAATLLQKSRFWPAYKLAMSLCISGHWDIAESIYKRINDEVVSETCYFWIKALLQISSAERLWSGSGTDAGNRKLVEASPQFLRLLESSLKSLEAAVQLDRSFDFEFQRRFLKLRTRFAKLVIDALVLCGSVRQYQRLHGDDPLGKGFLSTCRGKAQPLISDFQALAGDFYILSISFIGIDESSMQLLQARMLESSLMAFCTAFAFLPGSGNSETRVSGFTYKADVFDEVDRYLQRETTLQQFHDMLGRIAVGDLRYRRDVPWFKTQPAGRVVKNVWKQVSSLKPLEPNAATWSQEKGIPFLNQALNQLLQDKCVLPKYFFSTRPRAQLGLSMHTKQRDLIAHEGSGLSLSFGVVLSNLPRGCKPRRVTCMLTISSSSKISDVLISDELGKEHVLLKWLAHREQRAGELAAFVSTSFEVHQTQVFCGCNLNVSGLSQGLYQVSSCFSVCTDARGARWILMGPSFTHRLKVV